MSAHLYRSPLRPLDIGYVARLAGVTIDWEHTTIGPWESDPTLLARQLRERVYAFGERLPDSVVESFQLKSEGYRS